MMKQVIGALLAAAAFVPVAASAQDAGQGRRWGNRQAQQGTSGAQVQAGTQGGWQGRGDGGGRARGDAGVQAQADWQRLREQRTQVQQQLQAERQQVQVQQQAQGGAEVRRDWQRRQQAGQPGGWGDRAQADRAQREGRPQWDNRAQQDNRAQWDRGQQTDRAQWDRTQRDGRAQWDNRTQRDNRAQWDNRNGADVRTQWGSRGYDARRGNDGGRWNRTWHNDNRYDWNSYRASNRNAFRLPRYYAPYGWNYGYRRFSVGVTLSSVLWGQDYWIDDAYNYRLPEAYGPYRWVRYFNDALLVDLRTGLVVDTVYDIFY